MKKLLVVATLSIAVAAVIKRVTERKRNLTGSFQVSFDNREELDELIDDVSITTKMFENSLKDLNDFEPKLSVK